MLSCVVIALVVRVDVLALGRLLTHGLLPLLQILVALVLSVLLVIAVVVCGVSTLLGSLLLQKILLFSIYLLDGLKFLL